MIKNEKLFFDNVFHRLEENSILRNALKNKTFSHSQYHTSPLQIDENSLIRDALQNPHRYSPLPFLVAAEFMTCLNLYKVSLETRFLEILEDNIDMLMQERDVDHGHYDNGRKKTGNGWGCNYLVPGLWTYDVGTTSSFAFPIALYISECLTNPHIYLNNKFKIEKYIKICQEITDDFLDDIKECEKGAYLQQPWMTDIEPSNHTSNYICLLMMVYKFTNTEKYLLAAKKLTNYIKSSFRKEDDGTVCWPYRANMISQKSTHGERYWKSTWVVQMMLFCYQNSVFFTEEDLRQVIYTIKTNLIRNEIEVYDSLSRQAGVLVNEKRIEYHAQKGQTFSMKRLINFMPLGAIDHEIPKILERAIMTNEFYRMFNERFLELENYWVLEGLSYFLNPKRSCFKLAPFPHLNFDNSRMKNA